MRLCNLMKMTPYEMASLVMLPHKLVDMFERRNRISRPSRSSALVLTILEAHVLGEVHHDVIKNPFPDLNAVPLQTPA